MSASLPRQHHAQHRRRWLDDVARKAPVQRCELNLPFQLANFSDLRATASSSAQLRNATSVVGPRRARAEHVLVCWQKPRRSVTHARSRPSAQGARPSARRCASRLTLDMSGDWKRAKHAGRRPLDGRVRRQLRRTVTEGQLTVTRKQEILACLHWRLQCAKPWA